MIHIVVKKLACYRKVGHRITGNRQQGRSARVGYNRVHIAVDDATRLAYVEVLPDEQQGRAIGLLCRALAWFNGHGVECRQVMSDNESSCISKTLAKACIVLKLKHIRTRPYTPRTNGKAKRFIQTLCKEWAYAIPFQISQERNAWLPRYLSINNSRGSIQPSAVDLLSSGPMICSADQHGETEQLHRKFKCSG